MKYSLFILLIFLISCTDKNSKSSTADQENPLLVAWDFSKPKKITYSFSQSFEGYFTMNREQEPQTDRLIEQGHLRIDVNNNQLADLVLYDLVSSRISYISENSTNDTLQLNQPDRIITGMQPDKNFGDSGPDIFYKMIFPLPEKSLQIGETANIPMEMPFYAGTASLKVQGENQLTFTGYTTYKSYECAVLKGNIDISTIHLPAHLEGIYESALQGTGTYYFDPLLKHYVAVELDLNIHMKMDVPAKDPGNQEMYSNAQTNLKIEISLENIDE